MPGTSRGSLRIAAVADTVLVTGGTGFIGVYVVAELLERGYRVVALDVRGLTPEGRFLLGERAGEVAVEEGSVDDWARVLDVVRLYRPRFVVHLATITNPVWLERNPQPGLRVNFEGTINVLEAVRLFEVERLVYFSSIGVLPARQYEPIDAKHPVFLLESGVPTGVYGASKIASEAFCFAYHNAFRLDFRTIRPSAVYGFGMQWPIYVKPMVEGAVRGERVTFESGARFPRDYTHAADLGSLTALLLEVPQETPERIFYGATGRPLVTAGEVARIVEELVPGAEIEIADRFTAADLLELPYRGVLDVEPNLRLGWRPRYGDVRDGLADYVERYRAFLATS
jgi:nucleoside-diphosphate-sugar epimerase